MQAPRNYVNDEGDRTYSGTSSSVLGGSTGDVDRSGILLGDLVVAIARSREVTDHTA